MRHETNVNGAGEGPADPPPQPTAQLAGSPPASNPTLAAVLDPDAGTITLAVTFEWQHPWALDKCEAGALPGAVASAIRDACDDGGPLADWVQLAAIRSIRSWDPVEEVELGVFLPRVPLHHPMEG